MAKSTAFTAALASLAACAAALILPDQQAQQPLGGHSAVLREGGRGGGAAFPPSSSSPSSYFSSLLDDESFPIPIDLEPVHSAIDSLFDQVEAARHRVHDEFAKIVISTSSNDDDYDDDIYNDYDEDDQDAFADFAPDHQLDPFFDLSPVSVAAGGAPGDVVHGDQFDKVSIYVLLTQSSQCEHFVKLVDKFPGIVALLNDTTNDITVFVPSPSAFEHLPEDHEKIPREYLEKLLKYHIAIGRYESKTLAKTYTIPTAAREESLGDEPQRLRVSLGLHGVSINFYSRIVRADMHGKNGVIHAVDSVIFPPPYVGRILELFPSRFSTELLAVEKTKFIDFIHKQKMEGCTTFIPTNLAWARLGDRANAFLFNTEKGIGYLKALLKYQTVPDITLYTDSIYDKRKHGKDAAEDNLAPAEYKTEHIDLDTFLDDARLSVDLAVVFGFAVLKVNGFTTVIVPNVPAKNGVIHVIDRVPVPPCRRHCSAEADVFGEIEVEDLMDRLEPYLE